MDKLTQNTVNFVVNLVLKVLLAIAAIALLFYAGSNLLNPAKLFSLKRNKPTITVERTPMTVQDVRAVGKLVTANYYDEVVVRCVKDSLVRTREKDKNSVIVIIQTVHARLGIDLQRLEENDIKVQGDTSVWIKLPPVECLHLIMNPSDTDVYSESKGNKAWSLEQMKEALEPAMEMRKDEVIHSPAMEKARQGAEDLIWEFLTAFGYRHISIEHTLPEPEDTNQVNPVPESTT